MASVCTFSTVHESAADVDADFEVASAEAAAKEAEAELAAAIAAASAGGDHDAEAELASAATAAEEAKAELDAAMALTGQGSKAAVTCDSESLAPYRPAVERSKVEALTSQASTAQNEVKALRAVRVVDRRLAEVKGVVRRRSDIDIPAQPISDQHPMTIASVSVAHEDAPNCGTGGSAASPLCVVDEVESDGHIGDAIVGNSVEAELSEESTRFDAIPANQVESLGNNIEAPGGIPTYGMGSSRPRPPPLTLVWESTRSDDSLALPNAQTGSLVAHPSGQAGSSKERPTSATHVEISISTPAPLVTEAARSAALSGDCTVPCQIALPNSSPEPSPAAQCNSDTHLRKKDQVVTFHMPEMDPDSPCVFADTGSTPSEAACMGDCGGTPDFMSTRSFSHFVPPRDTPQDGVKREKIEACQMARATNLLGGGRRPAVHQPLVAVRSDHQGGRARVKSDIARKPSRGTEQAQRSSSSTGSSFSADFRATFSDKSQLPTETHSFGFDAAEIASESGNVQHWAIASPPSFSHLVSIMHADAECDEYCPGPDSLRGALNIMEADVGGTPGSGSATGDTGSTAADACEQDSARASAYVVSRDVDNFIANSNAGKLFVSYHESPCLSHPSRSTKLGLPFKNATTDVQRCMVVHMPSMDPDESLQNVLSPDVGGIAVQKHFPQDFNTADAAVASANRTASHDLSQGLGSSIDKISDIDGSTGLATNVSLSQDIAPRQSPAMLKEVGGVCDKSRDSSTRPTFDWSLSAVDRYKATCPGSGEQISCGVLPAGDCSADLLSSKPSLALLPPMPPAVQSPEQTGTSALSSETLQPCNCGMAGDTQPHIQILESSDAFADLRPQPKQLLENGEHYTGHWLGNLRHGRGKLELPGVGTFEGNFVQGKLAGHAVVTWENGDIYDGQWRDGQEQGLGIRNYADGSSHEGRWERGKKTGFGRESLADGSSFEGQFSGGLRHGNGMYRSADGSIFEGQFQHDKFDGVGRYTFADGQVYSGQWSQSCMHGEGSMKWPNGMAYDGQFHHDRKEGEGRFSWPGGRVYWGQFKAGSMHGSGTVYSRRSCHDSWTGTWEGGQRTQASSMEVESEAPIEAVDLAADAVLPTEPAAGSVPEAQQTTTKKSWRFSFSKPSKLRSNFPFRRPRITLCGLLGSTPSLRSSRPHPYAPQASQSVLESAA